MVHDSLIEECTTQAKIQQATHLPRSTISESLSVAVEQKLVQIQRISGSRTKYYRPKLSVTEIRLRYYDRAIRYTALLTELRTELSAKASAIVTDNEAKRFIQKLNNWRRAYTIAQNSAKQTKRLMIEELLKRAESSLEFVGVIS